MDAIALLEGLVAIYSPTGQETAAVQYLVTQMVAAGMRASVDGAGSAVGEVGEGPQTLMLLGHIDTVPGFIPVRREGDTLFGRGSVDAKGPLTAFVSAAARAAGRLKGWRVVVIGAVGEESDSRGAYYARDHYRPALTIIGEPSGWERITLGYKGSAWFEFTVNRTLAHTSAKNESACEAAVGYWNRVTGWAAERNGAIERVFEQVNPTLRGMQSGSDGFVESAVLRFGVRLPLGLSVESLVASLNGLTEDATLRFIEGVEAYRGEKNTPLVRAFLAAVRKAGGAPAFSVKTGTSDMNTVAPIWQTPILAYGPGDSNQDHTPTEHIQLSEYERAIEVLTDVLLTIAG